MKEENELILNLGIVIRGNISDLEKVRKSIVDSQVKIIYLKTSGYRIKMHEEDGR